MTFSFIRRRISDFRRRQKQEETALDEPGNVICGKPGTTSDSKPETLPNNKSETLLEGESEILTGSYSETFTDTESGMLPDQKSESFSESATEKVMTTNQPPVFDHRPDEVLLIFKCFHNFDYDFEHPSGESRLRYECHNLPGLPTCDADLQGFELVPAVGLEPDIVIAVTKLLQQEEWQDWYAKCALRSGARKLDNLDRRYAERIVLARKKRAQNDPNSRSASYDRVEDPVRTSVVTDRDFMFDTERDCQPPPAYAKSASLKRHHRP